MRILRNILLLVLPLIIFVNLYRFIVADVGTNIEYEYKGIHYFFEYFTTFNGLGHTIDTLNTIKESVLSYVNSTTEVVDWFTFWDAVGNFFTLVGSVLSLPIWVLTDIVLDVMWFLDMFMY